MGLNKHLPPLRKVPKKNSHLPPRKEEKTSVPSVIEPEIVSHLTGLDLLVEGLKNGQIELPRSETGLVKYIKIRFVLNRRRRSLQLTQEWVEHFSQIAEIVPRQEIRRLELAIKKAELELQLEELEAKKAQERKRQRQANDSWDD